MERATITLDTVTLHTDLTSRRLIRGETRERGRGETRERERGRGEDIRRKNPPKKIPAGGSPTFQLPCAPDSLYPLPSLLLFEREGRGAPFSPP